MGIIPGASKWRRILELVRSVIFEMDSKVVVNFVHCRAAGNAFLQPLISEICHMLHDPGWCTRVDHVYREANRAADWLASLGHSSPFHCNMLSVVPSPLGLILSEDCRGCSLPRLVPWLVLFCLCYRKNL